MDAVVTAYLNSKQFGDELATTTQRMRRALLKRFTAEHGDKRLAMMDDRGVSYVQASQDLNVHPSQLRDWVKKLSEDPQHAFPGHGQMKPEQLEIVRLKREVAKLKAERDILKKAAAYFAKEST